MSLAFPSLARRPVNEREMLSWLLIGAAVGDIVFTVLMRRAASTDGNAALRERARVSVFLTLGAVSLALLAVAFLSAVDLPTPIGSILFAIAVVWYFVPQPAWYLAYRLGRFR